MALSGILWTSTSGLQAVQQQLQWRTDNISNAQNASYARRDAVTTSTGVNSVQVDVARATDSGLQDQFLTSNSQSTFTTAQLAYFQRVGDVLGTAQSTPYLQQAVDNFTGAWKSFETDTSSSTSEANVLNTGQALADTISHTAQNLNQVENEVRADVGTTVTTLNSKLTQLDAINKQLSGEPLVNTVNPSLLDTRDSLVRDISGIVGVVRIVHSDNSIALYTKGGVALIDHGANQFQWNNPSGGQPWISLVNTTGTAAPSPSLNIEFTGGKLGASLGILDSSMTAMASSDPKVGTIAKARAQVDNLAVQLAGQKPGTFGGAYYAAPSDRTTDLAGGITGNTLSAGNPDIATAVAAANAAGNPTLAAQITANPALAIDANPIFWQNTDTDPATGATYNNSPYTIVSPSELTSGALLTDNITTNTAAFSTPATLNTANYNISPDPQNANPPPPPKPPLPTNAAGGKVWAPSNYWDGTPLSSFFTIDNGNAGPPVRAPSQSPSASFAINASLIDGTASIKRQSATPVIAQLTASTRSMFSGGVSSANQTYSGLASAIANYQAAGQAAVSDDNTRFTQTTQTLDTRLNSATGVNMDTEMAQLTVLQNAYAANARVINVVQTMFDTLLAIGK